MTEKLVAGLVTGVVIAPICAVCILGPAVFGSMLAGLFGWLTGRGPFATMALMVVGAILAYGYFERRKRKTACDVRGPRNSTPMTRPKSTLPAAYE